MLQCWSMMAERNGYLAKAQENLRSATSDLAQGRYNSGARSAYYACFHAAIAAASTTSLAFPTERRMPGSVLINSSMIRESVAKNP